MAAIPDEVNEKIRKFLDMLNASGIRLERVILFGSYAHGSVNRWSDIDIALVSRDFQGIGFYDRRKLNPYILKTDTRIEPHPYRPEDFTTDDPFIKEILKNGIEIAIPTPLSWA